MRAWGSAGRFTECHVTVDSRIIATPHIWEINMQTAPLKPARMELKTTYDAKELLNRAAALDGMDLTSFVLGPAIERARKVLSDHAIICLLYTSDAADDLTRVD